jgi:hypothetical protein
MTKKFEYAPRPAPQVSPTALDELVFGQALKDQDPQETRDHGPQVPKDDGAGSLEPRLQVSEESMKGRPEETRRLRANGDGLATGALEGRAPMALPSQGTQGVENAFRQSARQIHPRKDGRQLRRLAVYVPPDVARRFAAFCADRDVSQSDAMTILLSAALEDQGF